MSKPKRKTRNRTNRLNKPKATGVITPKSPQQRKRAVERGKIKHTTQKVRLSTSKKIAILLAIAVSAVGTCYAVNSGNEKSGNQDSETTAQTSPSSNNPPISPKQVATCISNAVRKQMTTALPYYDEIPGKPGLKAGTIIDGKRTIYNDNEEKNYIAIARSDADIGKRAGSKIYIDFNKDGIVDKVNRGYNGATSRPIAKTTEDQAEYEQGLRDIMSECKTDKIDTSVFEGIDGNNLSPTELFELLKKSKYFYPQKLFLSSNPAAKTIILFADTHGSPSIEYRQLKILKDSLNINTVGSEGYTGEIYKTEKGGTGIMAELRLTNRLVDDQTFDTFPIEKRDYKIEHMISALIERYRRVSNSKPGSGEYNFYLKQTNLIKQHLREFGFTEKEIEPEALHKIHADLAAKEGMEVNEFKRKVRMELREKYATEQIRNKAKQTDKKVLSIVYGLYHIPNFVKLLNEEEGFNVIVLLNPYELAAFDQTRHLAPILE